MGQPPPTNAPKGPWGPYPAPQNDPSPGAISGLTTDVLASGPGVVAAKVVGIEETSGPVRLAITTIADLSPSPNPNFLARPPGGAVVQGFNLPALQYPKFVISYYFNLAAATLFGSAGAGGWLEPGTSTAIVAHAVEQSVPFAAYGVRLMIDVIANSLSAGANVPFDVTVDGVDPTPDASLTVNVGVTGPLDTGNIFSQTGTAIGNKWGLVASQPIELATGSIEGTATLYLY